MSSRPKHLFGPVDETADFRPVGYIRHDHLGPPACLFNCGRHLVEFIGRTSSKDDRSTFLRQALSTCPSDAAAPPRSRPQHSH